MKLQKPYTDGGRIKKGRHEYILGSYGQSKIACLPIFVMWYMKIFSNQVVPTLYTDKVQGQNGITLPDFHQLFSWFMIIIMILVYMIKKQKE